MLQEYALDPSLLNGWSDFRFYVSQFGYDRGRLIARFPNTRWKRLVCESLANCGDVERLRIVEALRRIDHKLVPRLAVDWDEKLSWLENATNEHSVRPFHAIIAEKNERAHPSVIVGETLDDTVDYDKLATDDSHRLWRAHRSKIIARDAKEMADAIDCFVRQANVILFIDKHFGPENARHRIPFAEFMSRVPSRDSHQIQTVSVHCSNKAEAAFFKSQCTTRLAPLIPSTLTVQFHRWHNSDLHNRFVLTELGGVAFLEGLDQYHGSGREEDCVVLLDMDTAAQLIQDYTYSTTKFRHIDSFEMQGTKAE